VGSSATTRKSHRLLFAGEEIGLDRFMDSAASATSSALPMRRPRYEGVNWHRFMYLFHCSNWHWRPCTDFAHLRRSGGVEGACMKLRLVLAVLSRQALLPLFCIALTSCQSRQSNTGPSIEFSKIPPAAQGGRERVDTIAGHVKNARPGQQIVVYAHGGQWWVQPWPLISDRDGDRWWRTRT